MKNGSMMWTMPIVVPVKLFAAAEDRTVRFHLLHAKDRAPVEQHIVRKDTGEEVAKEDIRKAFAVSREKAVILQPEELQELERQIDERTRLLEDDHVLAVARHANDLEECRYYFDRLDSPALGWSFTVNHAHIRPNNIDAFMKGLDMKRCGEVRLADCRGTHEEHLKPGEGTIDFPRMFAAIEKSGYRGHYMQAFGSLDDMLKGRQTLSQLGEQQATR